MDHVSYRYRLNFKSDALVRSSLVACLYINVGKPCTVTDKRNFSNRYDPSVSLKLFSNFCIKAFFIISVTVVHFVKLCRLFILSILKTFFRPSTTFLKRRKLISNKRIRSETIWTRYAILLRILYLSPGYTRPQSLQMDWSYRLLPVSLPRNDELL